MSKRKEPRDCPTRVRVDLEAILRDPNKRARLLRAATDFICAVERIEAEPIVQHRRVESKP